MKSVGDKLKQYWSTQKSLTLRDGNVQEKLQHFEHKHSVKLPSDLAEYFLTIDGMQLNETDNEGFWFLPLQEISLTRKFHASSANFPDADNYYVFADYLGQCWWYAIRLTTENLADNPVLGIGWETPKQMARSFTEFIELYLVDHPRLYGGQESV